MIASTLICPNCGSKLTVSAAAPKVVTCPRCLYRMVNPSAAQTDASAPVPGSPQAPLRVLPLEAQASSDTSAINAALIVMIVLLAIGAFVSAATIGVSSAIFNGLIVVLMLAFVAIVIVTSYRKQKHDLQIAKAVEAMPPPPLSADQRAALSYFAPPPREPTNPLAAAGGFFSAIGTCAAGFVILAATVNLSGRNAGTGTGQSERAFFLLFVVIMVIGYMIGAPQLARRKGWKGFGTGAIIGLSLGMLALGPCAFCYLITLGA